MVQKGAALRAAPFGILFCLFICLFFGTGHIIFGTENRISGIENMIFGIEYMIFGGANFLSARFSYLVLPQYF